MYTFFLRQLFFGLFITTTSTYSLLEQGWNIDTQIGDMAAPSSDPLLQNGIGALPETPPGLALATADDGSNSSSSSDVFTPPTATPPKGSDIVLNPLDQIVAQGGAGNGCHDTRQSRTPPNSRRIRARDDVDEKTKCPAMFRPKDLGEWPENPMPNLVQGEEDLGMAAAFLRLDQRPRPNRKLCPYPEYPVPVCGNPEDTYDSNWHNYPVALTLDPCYLCMKYFIFQFSIFSFFLEFLRLTDIYIFFSRKDNSLVGCTSVEGGRIGYCCFNTDVAYSVSMKFFFPFPKSPPPFPLDIIITK